VESYNVCDCLRDTEALRDGLANQQDAFPLPHPRVFLQKSSESLEKKRVEFFGSAKEFARM
jgi:hypothetical protein